MCYEFTDFITTSTIIPIVRNNETFGFNINKLRVILCWVPATIKYKADMDILGLFSSYFKSILSKVGKIPL